MANYVLLDLEAALEQFRLMAEDLGEKETACILVEAPSGATKMQGV